jgi:hypothetical protein
VPSQWKAKEKSLMIATVMQYTMHPSI